MTNERWEDKNIDRKRAGEENRPLCSGLYYYARNWSRLIRKFNEPKLSKHVFECPPGVYSLNQWTFPQ